MPTEADLERLGERSDAAENAGKNNFFGFYTGMPKSDALKLATYDKFQDGEFSFQENAVTHEVYELRFSLLGVRRITGGKTFNDLLTVLEQKLGSFKLYSVYGHPYKEGRVNAPDGNPVLLWWHELKTIDGEVATLAEIAVDRNIPQGLRMYDPALAEKARKARDMAQRVENERKAQSAGRAPGEGGQAPAVAPEVKAMAAALEAAWVERTPANFAKMESEWKALPETWKSKLQKNVFWATCAMYLSKGHPEKVAARRTVVDEAAVLDALTEECPSCDGSGRSRELCRACGGTGRRNVPCTGCSGSGRCLFCHGSGQVAGTLGGHPLSCPQCRGTGRCGSCSGRGKIERACPNCSGGAVGQGCQNCKGTGRMASEERCADAVEANIEEALRTCRGQ